MSDGLGTYAFLPWLRRGAATQIARVDGAQSPAVPRASFSIQLEFNSSSLNATTNLSLYGPGEITGLDRRTVIRTWPRPSVYDAESNYLPLVEFDQADLPWRYTPAAPNAQDRLRPWIVLIALRADEIDSYSKPTSARPLAVLKVKDAASLPKLAQSWAWAHVQVSGRKTITEAEAATILQTAPHTILSRLVCPRRLDAKTKYRAFIVPAFHRGRLAGLGQTPADSVDGLVPAWADADAMIELPVYYEWEFETAAAGDFEYLVRLLEARPMPATVGTRPMDCRAPDPALPGASTLPLFLEGALLAPQSPARTWNAAERATFVSALTQLLNRPADLAQSGGDRVVAPPLYGRWHAARERLDTAGGPTWFTSLNADLRDRVSAGLGTLVVQDQQENLMAGAWRQVERIREVNERLRLAQLARESALQIYNRHLLTANTESFLKSTAPMFARVKGSPQTIARLVADSPVGGGVFEAQFRKVTRPSGPVARRQGRTPESAAASTLLDRMNRGEVQAAPPPKTPSKIITPAHVPGITPSWLTDRLLRWLERLPVILWLLALILAFAIMILISFGLTAVAVAAGIVAAIVVIAAFASQRFVDRLRLRIKLRDGTISGDDIRTVPARPGFTIVPDLGPGAPTPPPAQPAGGIGGEDSADARQFRAAAADLFDRLSTDRAPGRKLRPVPLQKLRETLTAALDPRTTIAAAVHTRLQLASSVQWEFEDPLEPIMAAPEFDQPMYEPLRDLSQDWLLPGLDQVPSNTISLLVTNQVFVEAYMVGLNHEMGRELLWREYPTDQRGTYFRQFWDVRGYVGPPGQVVDKEKLKDIDPIHAWPPVSPLGENSSRAPLPGDGEHLVLLIRGDLLRRYPTAVIYAVKARKVQGRRELTEPPEEKHPVFRGTLQPDVSFFGFELTAEEVRGREDESTDQGWFFLIQEQPSEPRFGFDVASYPAGSLASWNDLNWSHFAADQASLSAMIHIDLNASLPNTTTVTPQPGEPSVVWHADTGNGPAGTRASHLAYITLQRPVRVAVHGSDMLPPP